ncbi:hypothetical protein MC7420_3357 [Coleofasciculus chthonoplastes PCC 7420]|uniref:Uncharacterized protein n=1 Tax=Coleofasciculus chthonoplastes PCC 7420 TaxID=118168 RepID=B4VYX7_9CYAN|nr:hypothetical protein MC7420_3357 [Coleofasciculus chthonoplastes PCC 7420]
MPTLQSIKDFGDPKRLILVPLGLGGMLLTWTPGHQFLIFKLK